MFSVATESIHSNDIILVLSSQFQGWCEEKIEASESPRIEPSASGLSYKCSSIVPRPPPFLFFGLCSVQFMEVEWKWKSGKKWEHLSYE